MKEIKKRKIKKSIIICLTLSICLFQLSMIANNSLAQAASTITVSPDGTKDYTTIQAAIDNASAGDTIYVYNGTYYEHLTINKTLTLTGEQNSTTIIDGQKVVMNIITISADMVNFSGFTIQNSSLTRSGNIGIYIESQNTDIKSNMIYETGFGIYVYNDDNKIHNNTLSSINSADIVLQEANNNIVCYNQMPAEGAKTSESGLLLYRSDSNTLYNNSIEKRMIGLGLYNSSFNTLRNNSMQANRRNFGVIISAANDYYNNIDTSNLVDELHIYYYLNTSDITIDSSSLAGVVYCINCTNMTIKNSTLNHEGIGVNFYKTSNSRIESCSMMDCDTGIYLTDSDNNSIHSNKINNCTINIYVEMDSTSNHISNNYLNWTVSDPGLVISKSDNNIISHNTFQKCFVGIYVTLSTHADIQNNSIDESLRGGIVLFFDVFNSTVAYNQVTDCDAAGIIIDDGSSHNEIYANNISKNSEGINITGEGVKCDNNTLYHNDLSNNSLNAFDDCTNTWYNTTTKEGNYWSDYTGKESSRKGIGDIPYNISGGANQDLYPLIKPYEKPTSDLVFIMLVIAVILAIVFITIIAIFLRKK